MELLPFGDSGVLIRVGDAIDEATHARVRAVCAALDRVPMHGVVEIVPSYAAVAVYYEPAAFHAAQHGPYVAMRAALEQRLENLEILTPPPGKLVEVPVRYGGEWGPDLDDVARHAGMTTDGAVAMHTGAEYTVYMVGFSPGFPFLAGLPEQLAMPRRASPRTAVPAGSVAIGGLQTGIYTLSTPGGWNIIGQTTLRMFQPEAEPPALLEMGDRVRFVRVENVA